MLTNEQIDELERLYNAMCNERAGFMGGIILPGPATARFNKAMYAKAPALLAEVKRLREDKARLDWLQRCNDVMNRHYGTIYGWRVHRSHLVTRLMSGPGGEGHPAAIDVADHHAVVHDPACTGHPTVREAIDTARAFAHDSTPEAALAAQQRKEGE